MSQLCERCEASLVDEQCLACGYRGRPARSLPHAGQCLAGRYLLTRKVGEGSFGVVYEAEHQGLSRKVAIKVLHPHLVKHPQTLARFQREARALGALTHPYAVKLYEHGEEEGVHWIALEWLEGETLERRLRREASLTEAQVIALLLPLCEVLEEAHEREVLHRDIKPSNIFLVPLRSLGHLPKLVDFGLAKVQALEAMTSSQNISGTPKYMAPEQWEGLHKATPQSDLYSLAVVAYECLSGALPFEAESPIAWVRKLETERPRSLHEAMRGRPLSRELAALLMQCLEKEPTRRPKSLTQLRQALEAIPANTPRAPQRPAWRYAAGVAPLFLLGGYLASPKTAPKKEEQVARPTPPIHQTALSTPPTPPTSTPDTAPATSQPGEKPKKTPTKPPAKRGAPDLLHGELKEPFEP